MLRGQRIMKKTNQKINIRKIFLMIADAVLIILASLVSNAIISLYGIITNYSTLGVALQPIRVFGIMALEVMFC